jgi:hypothetical protein
MDKKKNKMKKPVRNIDRNVVNVAKFYEENKEVSLLGRLWSLFDFRLARVRNG